MSRPATTLAQRSDDHLQGITIVVRGMDLFEATDVHRLLQALLGHDVPEYFHHRLLIDDSTGVKLSKRDGSTSIRTLREQGVTVDEIRARVGCMAELI